MSVKFFFLSLCLLWCVWSSTFNVGHFSVPCSLRSVCFCCVYDNHEDKKNSFCSLWIVPFFSGVSVVRPAAQAPTCKPPTPTTPFPKPIVSKPPPHPTTPLVKSVRPCLFPCGWWWWWWWYSVFVLLFPFTSVFCLSHLFALFLFAFLFLFSNNKMEIVKK